MKETKIVYRYFGGLLNSHARWLNKMATRGYRLTDTGRLHYTFAPAEAGAVQYAVEYVGDLRRAEADRYCTFLKEMGYRVWVKPINLNWSVGKVVLRPSAEGGVGLASSGTTLNRELFIVEKVNDGRPFSLHTTVDDRIAYTKRLRRPPFWLVLFTLLLAGLLRQWAWLIVTAVALVPLAAAQIELVRLAREAKTRE